MEPSLTFLAKTIDDWATQGACRVVENDRVLAIAELTADNAKAIRLALLAIGWPVVIEDASASIVDQSDISADFEPFKVEASKPSGTPEICRIVTNTWFQTWLAQIPDAVNVVRLARLNQAFETYSLRFAPWDDQVPFAAIVVDGDPRRIVRESGPIRKVVGNVGPWLLRQSTPINWEDPIFHLWASKSVESICRVLGNELEPDGAIMFRGPPVVRFKSQNLGIDEFSQGEFVALQNCADWVFRSGAECETRHGLLAAEFARTNVGSSDAAKLFKQGSTPALEGAKIAHQLGLQKLSSDSLKAISDLRKAIVDEATKLSDTTRQLVTAVTSALFVGVGLIAGRLTVTTGSPAISWAVALMGVILFCYVLAVFNSGRQFMNIQRDLRKQWRDILYRFLSEDSYKLMVSDPANKAERSFMLSAIYSLILAFVLMVVILFTAYYGPLAGPSLSAAQSVLPSAPGSTVHAGSANQLGSVYNQCVPTIASMPNTPNFAEWRRGAAIIQRQN